MGMTIEQDVNQYRAAIEPKVFYGILTEQEADKLADEYEKDLLWELKITG